MDYFKKELDDLKANDLLRTLKNVSYQDGSKITINSRTYLQFSSNNYLGLLNHPEMIASSTEATFKYGTGSGASRLISGNVKLYEMLEKKLSDFKSVEASLVFSSGYMANLGIISTLAGKDDVILCDKLNHASIVDGCLMSRAKFKRYPHKDLCKLEEMLKNSLSFKKRLIVTDAIFSMDGDIAPLPELMELSEKYDAILLVDEAHAIGTLGKTGRGICEHFNVNQGERFFTVGTFGKALGSFGAYVCGSNLLRDFLINKCRKFIFTTALPPSVLASSIKALEILKNDISRVSILRENSNYLRVGLRQLGCNTLFSNTHIIPVLIGDSKETIEFSDKLLKKGIFVSAIRPPTVKKGTSRLRISVTSDHTLEDLNFVLEAFKSLKEEKLPIM